jgi:hypothetical protein
MIFEHKKFSFWVSFKQLQRLSALSALSFLAKFKKRSQIVLVEESEGGGGNLDIKVFIFLHF